MLNLFIIPQLSSIHRLYQEKFLKYFSKSSRSFMALVNSGLYPPPAKGPSFVRLQPSLVSSNRHFMSSIIQLRLSRHRRSSLSLSSNIVSQFLKKLRGIPAFLRRNQTRFNTLILLFFGHPTAWPHVPGVYSLFLLSKTRGAGRNPQTSPAPL